MHTIDPNAQIKLVAVDMDGTFLDGEGQIPEAAWAVIDELQGQGISFVPASGRQFATLREQFAQLGEIAIIAENGTVVMHGENEIYSNIIAGTSVAAVIAAVRAQEQLDAGLVLCGRRTAYVERSDAAFTAAIAPYYRAVQVVEDLTQVQDEIIKMAVNVGTGAVQEMAAALEVPLQVVISGSHWVDAMNHGVHKGLALNALQEKLGVGADETAVFGDYPNDLEMIKAATYSFAMANAHPVVAAAANFTAPANTEHGVLQVLRAYLQGRSEL
ncbi:HAD family hydrolase [Arthrobacter sp. MYb211]|uniref:Cof-type HAD-IIB family hydrolase n=1 Tax=Micrococcaceae TaxID=1268 RepID=UPI000CFCB205|nr:MULTISPECIES: HAD family hydrolase [unclassified Arthrobacter]PQZ96824.1 HAD family hydrolase [Arthrobacter sp. MYb224]PRA10029.1 HAD family hydrolase [Arthrobacter sp. MYb221]PRC05221.1 HAD family hydrolase [Arthrobacter sp. MYb211]